MTKTGPQELRRDAYPQLCLQRARFGHCPRGSRTPAEGGPKTGFFRDRPPSSSFLDTGDHGSCVTPVMSSKQSDRDACEAGVGQGGGLFPWPARAERGWEEADSRGHEVGPLRTPGQAGGDMRAGGAGQLAFRRRCEHH